MMDLKLIRTKKEDRIKGFTLLEMLVATGIFTIVAVIFASMMVQIIQVQRHAREIKDLIENVRYALDSMSKNILVGKNYRCINPNDFNPPDGVLLPADPAVSPPYPARVDCDGVNGFLFESQGSSLLVGDIYAYRFNSVSHAIERAIKVKTPPPAADGPYVAITDPRIRVESLDFDLSGVVANDNLQPRVVIRLTVSIISSTGTTTLRLENIISQRRIDT